MTLEKYIKPDKPNRYNNLFQEKILFSLALLLMAFLILQLVLFQYGRDQGIYAVVGRTILEGGAPYKDAWDFKPPAIFFIYALARFVFGSSQHGVRILEALSFLALTGAFAVFTRRHLSSWSLGILGGVLALLNHVQLGFWDTGQPESFGAALLAWALVLATFRPHKNSSQAFLKQVMAWFFSGLLFALAALLKPPLGGGLICSTAIIAFVDARNAGGGSRFKHFFYVLFFFAFGAVVALMPFIFFFASKGAIVDIYDIFFQFVPTYTAIQFSPLKLPSLLASAVKRWLFYFSLMSSAGMCLMLLLAPRHSREREGCAHVFGVIVPQLLGVALQAKFFSYHFGAILPFSALCAVWGFAKLWQKTDRRGLLLAGFVLMTAWQMYTKGVVERGFLQLRAMVNSADRARINDELYSIRDINAWANRKAAEWISKNTPAEIPVYIWGFEPVIYDLANRHFSSKYIYNVPQRADWQKESTRKALMQELSERPPSVIVAVHNDQFKHVTGNQRDSAEELKNFSELSYLIQTDYKFATSFEDLDIYLLKKLLTYN
jgi:hypothetical protein